MSVFCMALALALAVLGALVHGWPGLALALGALLPLSVLAWRDARRR